MADRKSFLLRLPPDLLEALNRWSRDDLRSLNGQIEYLLREAARRAGRIGEVPPPRLESPAAGDAPRENVPPAESA